MPTQTKPWSSSGQLFSRSLVLLGQTISFVLLYLVLELVVIILTGSAIGWITLHLQGVTSLAVRALLLLVSAIYHTYWGIIFIKLGQKPTADPSLFSDKRTWQKLVPVLIYLVLSGVAIFVASLFFIIPGVLLALWWFAGAYVLVIEGGSIKQAFYRSRSLARGYAWPLLGRLSFIIFIWGVAGLFAFVPSSGLFVFTILTILLTPLLIYFFGLTYQELVAIKQANANSVARVTTGQKILLTLLAVLALAFFSFISYVANLIVSVSVAPR